MNDDAAIRRREFLTATGLITGLLSSGSALSLLAPSRAWALDLTALSSSEGACLLSVARTIAPHDTLEDAAYALVVKDIDSACAADDSVRTMVGAGLQQLGASFAGAGENDRVAALKAMEQSQFFRFARAHTLGTLYSSALAYAHFGYEGEAFSKGGYLLRGFNDLRWLPEVPLADSGPVPGGAASGSHAHRS